jgi:hypothetical protein
VVPAISSPEANEPKTGRQRSVGAAIRQSLRYVLIAAADGRLDQLTDSRPVLKLGGRLSFAGSFAA